MSPAFDENTTAWLGTTASQIFFMQLGFLCFEVGFVKDIWTESIILKNIEDTIIGIITFLALGYTLSESHRSVYGIISIPESPLLIGIEDDHHDQIFISSLFAASAATIISGAVLQRMKNKAYIVYSALIVLVNYSFVSHWVWHEDGWLNQLGFTDGAGAAVVHSTAGIASTVAVWKLGPRKEAIGKNGKLLPVERATRPIIHTMGAFLLWYGWFAFNVSSPIAFSKGLGDAVGTTALVTAVSPVCSACGGFIWMKCGWINLTFENLLSCILAGLVSITAPCHSCNIIESGVIGFIASIIYFSMARIIRNKWQIDDPLQVISIHLVSGVYSCFAEGIVANGVYGTDGLIYGGYHHFGIQCLGIITIVTFNFIMCWLLYTILEKCICRNTNIRVTTLDTYLGRKLFEEDIDSALNEVLKCDSNTGRRMLWKFHKYMVDRYCFEQLDFLIAIEILNNILDSKEIKKSAEQIAKYILKIINTYVDKNSDRCINISGEQRAVLFKIKQQILSEITEDVDIDENKEQESEEEETNEFEKYPLTSMENQTNAGCLVKYKMGSYKSGLDITQENVFHASYQSVWGVVQSQFTQFLIHSFVAEKRKFSVRIPFKLNEIWIVEWDKKLTKQTSEPQSLAGSLQTRSILLTEIKSDSVDVDRGQNIQNMHSLREMTLKLGDISEDDDDNINNNDSDNIIHDL